MYHVIAAPPAGVAFPDLFVRPADFTAQMHWLAAHGYHAVTLHQVYDYWLNGTPLPEHPIVLSFDDGYIGQETHAMPILHELLAAGWELDAHTITHPDLTHVDDAQLWHEVDGSRVELQHMFHVPVDFFCYPSGRYDPHVVDAVQRAGYLGATTTSHGLARPQDIYTLSRIRINGADHVLGFARKLESLAR